MNTPIAANSELLFSVITFIPFDIIVSSDCNSYFKQSGISPKAISPLSTRLNYENYVLLYLFIDPKFLLVPNFNYLHCFIWDLFKILEINLFIEYLF